MAHSSPTVRSTLNYTLDNGITPDHYFYEPPAGTVRHPPGDDPQEVEIRDGWPDAHRFDVDREGFAVADCAIPFDRFDDHEAIRATFYRHVAEFVRARVGARRVHVFDHNIRSKVVQSPTTTAANPVMLVHSDYTVKSGPQRVADVLPDEADELRKRRYAFFNVWKPIRRVEELPLGVCDVTSAAPGDMLRMELRYPDRTGEIYAMRFSPAHRWVYFPYMEADQALLLKCYDSEEDGRARFMGHSAFVDPTSATDAPPRESIEVRTIAFF